MAVKPVLPNDSPWSLVTMIRVFSSIPLRSSSAYSLPISESRYWIDLVIAIDVPLNLLGEAACVLRSGLQAPRRASREVVGGAFPPEYRPANGGGGRNGLVHVEIIREYEKGAPTRPVDPSEHAAIDVGRALAPRNILLS